LGGGDLGEEVQRDEDGAEENFLRHGAGDVVSEADAAAESGGEGCWAGEPVAVGILDYDIFEEGAKEEEEG
jgi:hypothetical protein